MDTIQINITDIPNEVTINVSNLQGPPGPSGATATLQEVVNNGNIVEFEFAKTLTLQKLISLCKDHFLGDSSSSNFLLTSSPPAYPVSE